MNRENIISKIKKVLALAERGVDGEAVSARNLLEQMMQKYGISEEEFNSNAIRELSYMVGKENSAHYLLLGMVVSLVLKTPVSRVYSFYFTRHIYDLQFVRATNEEHAEIASLFEFFKAGYDRSMEQLKRSQQDETELPRRHIRTLKEEIKETQSVLKEYKKDLRQIQQRQARSRKMLLRAFANKNNLFTYYRTPEEEWKISSRKGASIPGESWNFAEELDDPNMLPGLRIGEGGQSFRN